MKKVINRANAEVGYMGKETRKNLYDKTKNAGKNGFSKYWDGIFPDMKSQPYCTAFMYWIFAWAYGMKKAKLIMFCYKGFFPEPWKLEQQFKKRRRYSNIPYIGSIAFFQQKEWTDHVGIVTDVLEEGFYSVEGNVMNENGIPCVAKRYHLISEKTIKGFGHPLYRLLLEIKQEDAE